MRLSLLSDDGDVAELLITKALELMSEAQNAAADEEKTPRSNGAQPGQPDEPH